MEKRRVPRPDRREGAEAKFSVKDDELVMKG
jgi:hypothetical protein